MFLLRTIRKSNWHPPSWLQEGSAPADGLLCLKSQDNAFSVWEVAADCSNLDRVLAAIAGKRDVAVNVDYALIQSEVFQQLGIELLEIPGDTPDQEANDLWHRDAIKLTASAVARLAESMMKQEVPFERKNKKGVKEILKAAVASGHIATDDLKPQVRKSLAAFTNPIADPPG